MTKQTNKRTDIFRPRYISKAALKWLISLSKVITTVFNNVYYFVNCCHSTYLCLNRLDNGR